MGVGERGGGRVGGGGGGGGFLEFLIRAIKSRKGKVT